MDPQVASAWRLDLATVTTVPAGEVEALIEGPPLRVRPFLIKGSGPAVYVVDDPLPVPGGDSTGGSEGATGATGGTGEVTSAGGTSEAPTTTAVPTTTGAAGETGGGVGSSSGGESTGAAVEGGDAGCGCDTRGGSATAGLGLMLLGLRRRRGAR